MQAQADETTVMMIKGESIDKLPDDLYIPPDALRVFLETFQGPLDLLLYLIKKQNLDITEIPIVQITGQYLQYIDLMHTIQMDLAGEYLLMAAMLAEIKSRLLLPRPVSAEEEGEAADPRAELVRRLQEYERFKNAAEALDELPRMDRELSFVDANAPKLDALATPVEVDLSEIMNALSNVLKRAAMYTHHRVVADTLTLILDRVSEDNFMVFTELFTHKEGRLGIVVSLIALLELTREAFLELVQNEPGGTIYVRAKKAEFSESTKEVTCDE